MLIWSLKEGKLILKNFNYSWLLKLPVLDIDAIYVIFSCYISDEKDFDNEKDLKWPGS